VGWVGLGVGDRIYSLDSIKIIISKKSPLKDSEPDRACECVCVCVSQMGAGYLETLQTLQ